MGVWIHGNSVWSENAFPLSTSSILVLVRSTFRYKQYKIMGDINTLSHFKLSMTGVRWHIVFLGVENWMKDLVQRVTTTHDIYVVLVLCILPMQYFYSCLL